MFTGTYDGTTMCLYHNGTQLSCQTTDLAYDGYDYSNIGAFHAGGNSSSKLLMNGSINDVRYYDHALNKSEVGKLYNETK